MVIGKFGLLATKIGLIFVVVAVAVFIVHPAQIFGNPAQYQGPEGGSSQVKTPSGSPYSDSSGSSGNAELSPPSPSEVSNPPVAPNQLSPPSPNEVSPPAPKVPLSGSSASQSYDNGGSSGGVGFGTPVMKPILAQSVNQTQLLVFNVSATDPNGKSLTYNANNVPTNASFNTETHVFSWVPLTTQHGLYIVNFSASNGVYSAFCDARIYVYNIGNRPPVWTITPEQEVNETELLSFQVNATDPDGDPITYSAAYLPANATFNASTQIFSWTPVLGQAGEYDVIFSASDGILQTDMQVEIDVESEGPTPVPEFPLPGVPVAILAAVALMISVFKTKKPGQ